MALEHVTTGDFEEKAGSTGVVVIDFAAAWCGPCQMMGPIFEKVAGEYDGKAKFLKIDIDQAQELAVRFGVQSIPTLLILKDGEEADRHVGMMPEPALKKFVDAQL